MWVQPGTVMGSVLLSNYMSNAQGQCWDSGCGVQLALDWDLLWGGAGGSLDWPSLHFKLHRVCRVSFIG